MSKKQKLKEDTQKTFTVTTLDGRKLFMEQESEGFHISINDGNKKVICHLSDLSVEKMKLFLQDK